MLTQERISAFSRREQLLLVGSEFERARVWQYIDKEKWDMALERAVNLINLIIKDPKWKPDLAVLQCLRDETQNFLSGKRADQIEILYRAL